jgi:hypothetical protein
MWINEYRGWERSLKPWDGRDLERIAAVLSECRNTTILIQGRDETYLHGVFRS